MRRTELLGTGAKLIVEDNVIAVKSDAVLTVVSSAIYNGGFKKVNAILNIQVPEGYSDVKLHHDPLHLVRISSEKVEVHHNFVAMITAAKVGNKHHVTKTDGKITVNVIATAGASHGESAGEPIDALHLHGTINIIVIISGNPTDSCLVSALVTATEAKTAALNDLDIRSRYSGDAATGTITDSLSVAATNTGQSIHLGGPASKLGQLVASCVREAVKEAIQKQDGTVPSRSTLARLRARQLSIEKMSLELSKMKSFSADKKTIAEKLKSMLSNPLYASFLMAATKLDDDGKKGLIPEEFGNVETLSETFGNLISQGASYEPKEIQHRRIDLKTVDLPPFLKHSLFRILSKECT